MRKTHIRKNRTRKNDPRYLPVRPTPFPAPRPETLPAPRTATPERQPTKPAMPSRFPLFPVFCMVLFFLSLPGPANARAAPTPDTTSDTAPNTVPTAPETASCTPVAHIYGDTLCHEQLGPQQGHDALPVPPPGEGGPPAEQQRRILRDSLWHRALTEKFDEADIMPTEEDITLLRTRIQDSMTARHDADRLTALYLTDLLEKNKYHPEDAQALRELAQASALSARFYEDQQQRKAELPPEYAFLTTETEHQIALTMLLTWKGDRALLAAYGGRLIRTPTGLTPVDARRAFIRHMETDGNMTILDPAFADIFVQEAAFLQKLPDTPQTEIISPDTPLYKSFLSDPGWRFPRDETARRMEKLRLWAESLRPAPAPTAPDSPAPPAPP